MSRTRRKDRVPIVILCFVCLTLLALGGYAAVLRLRANAPEAVVRTVETHLPTPSPAIEAQTATPEPTETPVFVTPAPQTSETAESAPFWSEGILRSDAEYRSPTLFVTVRKVRDKSSFRSAAVYYVADVYVKDVTQIMTASAKGDFARRGHGDVAVMAKKADALLAISGDYYSAHNSSLVVRNGVAYRTSTGYGDVCVLLKNGEMETIRRNDVSVAKILEKDPWQVWEFGPALLDEYGKARTSFPESHIAGTNPRACIGYVEPGHYLFVVADGRQNATRGMRLADLAALMESLGCKTAFNLDGGASAHFYWKNRIYNQPCNGGREISDIIYIAKEPYHESRFFCGKAGTNK